MPVALYPGQLIIVLTCSVPYWASVPGTIGRFRAWHRICENRPGGRWVDACEFYPAGKQGTTLASQVRPLTPDEEAAFRLGGPAAVALAPEPA